MHGLAIHPSGRAALSVAADSKLMLWNLTTGKCNYTSALPEPARLIGWTPDGDAYAYESRKAIFVYRLRTGELLHTLPHASSPPLAMAFLPGALLVSGDEAGELHVWSLTTGKLLHTETGAHEFRVKAVAAAPSAEATAGGSGQVCFASASSDGTISLWALSIGASGKPKGKKASKSDGEGISSVDGLTKLMTINTRLRLTTVCMSEAAGEATPAGGRVAAAAMEADAASEEDAEASDEEAAPPAKGKRPRVAAPPADEGDGLKKKKKLKKKLKASGAES